MTDGKGCKCAARCEAECGCRDADWTRQDLIDARAEIARLRMTDAEREAIMVAWRLACSGGPLWDHANTLRGLLERHGGGDE